MAISVCLAFSVPKFILLVANMLSETEAKRENDDAIEVAIQRNKRPRPMLLTPDTVLMSALNALWHLLPELNAIVAVYTNDEFDGFDDSDDEDDHDKKPEAKLPVTQKTRSSTSLPQTDGWDDPDGRVPTPVPESDVDTWCGDVMRALDAGGARTFHAIKRWISVDFQVPAITSSAMRECIAELERRGLVVIKTRQKQNGVHADTRPLGTVTRFVPTMDIRPPTYIPLARLSTPLGARHLRIPACCAGYDRPTGRETPDSHHRRPDRAV